MRKLFFHAMMLGAVVAAGTASAENGFQGFGNDVPLSFAVKQIVPPGHEVFFASNVNQEIPVSWTGGGAWEQILGRTLEQHDLVAEIVADKVIVSGRERANISYTESRGYPMNTEVLRAPGMVVRPYTTVSDPVPAPAVPVERPAYLQEPAPPAPAEPPLRVTSPSIEPAPQPPARAEPVAPGGAGVDPFAPVDRAVPGYVPQTAHPQTPPQLQPMPRPQPQPQPQPMPHSEPHHQVAQAPTAHLEPSFEPLARSPVPVTPESHKPAQQEWVVRAGLSLQDVLSDWTEAAGWSLVWDSAYEYPIMADAVFYGPFISHDAAGGSLAGAAVDLISSMATARPPVNADFYLQNRVMVITTSLEEHD